MLPDEETYRRRYDPANDFSINKPLWQPSRLTVDLPGAQAK